MAHIPMDDAKKLYNESGGSWDGLRRAVDNDEGKSNGIGDYLIIDLKAALKNENGSFPNSPEGLYEKLNSMLQGMPHQTTAARERFGND